MVSIWGHKMTTTVPPGRRAWKCPICQRDFAVKASAADPDVCPDCRKARMNSTRKWTCWACGKEYEILASDPEPAICEQCRAESQNKSQLAATGIDRIEVIVGPGHLELGFAHQAHYDRAKELLLPGEEIELAITGRVHEASGTANGSFGLLQTETVKGGHWHMHYLIVTDRRVILWGRGLLRSSTDAFEFKEIRSVELQKGILSAAIRLNVGRLENFAHVNKQQAERAVTLIRQKIADCGLRKAAASHRSDLATQLQQLAALKEAGTLSDEEFAAAKARLLKG
jgi:DNA-directed RNA polymerase subunit RPC12/RpoP